MISKPGGATVRPDDFYRLYALHMQVGVLLRRVLFWGVGGWVGGCTERSLGCHARKGCSTRHALPRTCVCVWCMAMTALPPPPPCPLPPAPLCAVQATQGDNATERPMWAERGGLDFEGRARWDAWAALRGLDGARARLRFVKLLHEFSPAALYKDTRGAVLQQQAPPPQQQQHGLQAA